MNTPALQKVIADVTDRSGYEIPRRENLSYDEFAREYLYPSRPVILTHAISNWRALEKWNPEFFKSEFGSRVITIDGKEIMVADFVDLVVGSSEMRPAPYLAFYGDKTLEGLFPELVGDIEPVPEYLVPNWLSDWYFPPALGRKLNRGTKPEFFFGGKGASFPYLHWDNLYFHAFNSQIYGQKEWYLYAPDQTCFLYPSKDQRNASMIREVRPDLERFPLFKKAVSHQCVVEPGEMLFIPAGWWHITRMQEPSISVAINCANASNWSGISGEVVERARCASSTLAPAVAAYLNATGWYKSLRDRWRGVPVYQGVA